MSALRNGRGITAESLGNGRQDAYQAGQPIGDGRDVAYQNPYLPQISTLTLAATADVSDEIVADQLWTITLTDPDGVAYVTTYLVTAADNTAGTDGAGLAHMATQLAAALEGDADLDNLVDATSSAAVITVTWRHPNQGAWTITAVCTPAAAEAVLLATPATSQTAGGVVIPMARFVTYGTLTTSLVGGPGRRAALPTAVTNVIAGIALKDYTQVRPFDTTASAVNSYPIGAMVSVREVGEAAMQNVGDATAVAGGAVWAVVATTGGDALGEARSDRDGTADVWTLTPTVADTTLYAIQLTLPAWENLPLVVRTYEYTSDGSAADSEITADFISQINGDATVSARVTASGTATLIITGDILGMPILVQDAPSAGDWTSITHTTTAAAYTVLVPHARWTIPTAAEAIGRVYVNQ